MIIIFENVLLNSGEHQGSADVIGYIGLFVGGAMAIWLFGNLIEWVIVKRTMDDERRGAMVSFGSAYLLAVIVYGFGAANGGPWTPLGLILYAPGLALVLGLRLHALNRQGAL